MIAETKSDLATLKARLALAPEPRKVALGLSEFDFVKLGESRFGEMASVTFNTSATDSLGVITLQLYTDGTYDVASSTCVPTSKHKVFAEAYARSLKFVETYGLKSKD